MKKLLVLGGLLISSIAKAGNVVDLYGEDFNKAQQLVKQYGKQVSELETKLFTAIAKPDFNENNKEFLALVVEKQKLINQIKKENNYSYVDFETVFYPNNPNQFTTIEIIKKNQPERLHFVQPHYMVKKKKTEPDLIDKMIQFNELVAHYMVTNQLNGKNYPCPAYHCLPGFEHPHLKPYFKIFTQGALGQRQLILDNLKSSDPERRAAAVFLVGHFKNPHDIINQLTPYVTDADSTVRNNAMRVIGMTINKANITNINVRPFINVLNSPYETDRNKALYVLDKLAESKSGRQILLHESKDSLLAMLQLQQPNNHDFAYKILKKISHKNFSDKDIPAWKNWLDKA